MTTPSCSGRKRSRALTSMLPGSSGHQFLRRPYSPRKEEWGVSLQGAWLFAVANTRAGCELRGPQGHVVCP